MCMSYFNRLDSMSNHLGRQTGIISVNSYKNITFKKLQIFQRSFITQDFSTMH